MRGSFETMLRQLQRAGREPIGFSTPFVDALPVTGASVSTLGGVLGSETLSATDARAALLDELQLDLGEGPCWDALRTARPVSEPALQENGRLRWPALVGAVQSEAIRSLFAFPLAIGSVRLGAVDLYSEHPIVLDADDERKAAVLADVVSRHILRAALEESTLGLEDQQPLSRRVIHQATGVVLAQLELSPDDARLMIQGHAFATGRPMTEISEDIVDGRLRFQRRDERIEVEQ